MSAIITHRFRKNNVQNIFDEMTLPKVMIANCSSSGAVITPVSGVIPANLQTGMAATITSGTGSFSGTYTTLITTISSGNFTVSPAPIVTLSGALLSFFSQYYIGIGKADPYKTPDGSDSAPGSPVACTKTEVDVRNNLIALQKINVALNTGSAASQTAIYGNAGYVLPRYNWISNAFYKAWDPTDPSCFYTTSVTSGSTQYTAYPCYAVYNTKVYICAQSGINSSSACPVTISPDTNATVIGTVGVAGADTYRWVYVSDLGLDTAGTLTAQNLTITSGNTSSTLDSNQFFKIYRRATSTGSSSTITTPTSSAGKIYSCRVVAGQGGSGYKTSSTFAIDGDGIGAAGQVTSIDPSSGAILTVAMTNSGTTAYTTGVVRFVTNAGTSPATILPCIAPANGFGYDVTSDLPAWYAGFYGSFSYDATYPGSADVPSTDQIRQLSLIRNPIVSTSSTGSPITYRCLKSLTLSDTTGQIPEAGDIIEQGSGGDLGAARGWVDHVVGTKVYYHQNSSTFGSIGQNITPTAFTGTTPFRIWRKSNGYSAVVAGTGNITPSSADEYTAGTGDVIFVQNRTPITQALGQSESITIVTQF
jgi:hypothetical protein